VGAVRLELRLTSQSEWIKMFDPRDWNLFVPCDHTALALERDAEIRIDLDVGGWRVTLRGTVVSHREDPQGVLVALDASEKDKINYLNGFLRGGLLNLREKRRLPIRLQVTYGAIEGPANTFTRDINEEGVFLFTTKPLPETSQVHMLIAVPDQPQPLSLVGKVSHTILPQEEDAPGMGIVFELDDAARLQMKSVIKLLEQLLSEGKLPTNPVE
jgi:Tfp pilus assembly protein PilZ